MANLKSLSTNLYGESSRDAMAALFNNSELLRWLESVSAWERDATDFDYWTVGGSSTLQNIAEGGSFTAQDVGIDAKQTGSLKFYGGGFKVTNTRKFDEKEKLRGIDTYLTKKRNSIYRATAKALTKAIFVDNGTGNLMTGFSKKLDGTRLLGYENTTNFTDLEAKRVLDASTFCKTASVKTMDLSTDTEYDGFMEMFYTAVALMDNVKGIVIPDFAKPRITTIARKAGLLGSTANFEREMQTIGGIPLISVPNDVITRTEPDNTTTPLTNTTSMYFLSPEEQRCSLVTNSGFYYYEHDHRENEEKGLEQFGINLQLKIEDNKSVLRVRNLKI